LGTKKLRASGTVKQTEYCSCLVRGCLGKRGMGPEISQLASKSWVLWGKRSNRNYSSTNSGGGRERGRRGHLKGTDARRTHPRRQSLKKEKINKVLQSRKEKGGEMGAGKEKIVSLTSNSEGSCISEWVISGKRGVPKGVDHVPSEKQR